MFKALYNALLEWNRNASEREKLQHTYFAIAVVSVLVAGVVALINSESGKNLLVITKVALAIFVSNAVVWALLDSTILVKLSGRRKRN